MQTSENAFSGKKILHLKLDVALSPPEHLAESVHPFLFLNGCYDKAATIRYFEEVLVTLDNTHMNTLQVKKPWIDNLVKAGWKTLTDKGEGVNAAVFIKGDEQAAIHLEQEEITWSKSVGIHEFQGECYVRYNSDQGHGIYVQQHIKTTL